MKRRKERKPVEQAVAAEQSAAGVPAWVHGLVVLGLILAVVILYGRTFGLGFFNLDDPDYIQNNPYLEPLNAANFQHILSQPYFANYAPGHLLTYALDIRLAGSKSAWAMHLSNVLWYAWVVCMVYVLSFTIRPSLMVATAAALLFLAHPAHVEVVAWLSSRKDLIATGFGVLSTACYLRYRAAVRGRAVWWYGASLFSYLAASSGKQSIILLPLVLLAWDLCVEQRRNWQMLVEKVPYGLITLLFGWMTWQAQPSTGQAPNLFVICHTELSNLWLLSGLGDYVLYRPSPKSQGMMLRIVVVGLALAMWVVPVLLFRLRLRLHAALCLWVLIQMVPPMTLSFLTPVTDRYLFLPSVGVCILLAQIASNPLINSHNGSANRSSRSSRRDEALTTSTPKGMSLLTSAATTFMERIRQPTLRPAAWVALGLLVCAWTWKTVDYINQWRDPKSVWFFAAAKMNSPQAYEYSGSVYQDAADRIQASLRSGNLVSLTNELRLARVVVADPERVARMSEEWTGLYSGRTNTVAYRDQLWRLAWERYEQAIAHRGTLNEPTLFLRRGMLLVDQGRDEEAIKEFHAGLKLAQAHLYRKVRMETGTHLERAIGVAYWNMHQYPQARDWLHKAQETQRKSGQVWISTLDDEVQRVSKLAEKN